MVFSGGVRCLEEEVRPALCTTLNTYGLFIICGKLKYTNGNTVQDHGCWTNP